MRVEAIQPDGPAFRSRQLYEGDIILEIEGRNAAALPSCQEAIMGPAGTPVRLTILRNGAVFNVAIVRDTRNAPHKLDHFEVRTISAATGIREQKESKHYHYGACQHQQSPRIENPIRPACSCFSTFTQHQIFSNRPNDPETKKNHSQFWFFMIHPTRMDMFSSFPPTAEPGKRVTEREAHYIPVSPVRDAAPHDIYERCELLLSVCHPALHSDCSISISVGGNLSH